MLAGAGVIQSVRWSNTRRVMAGIVASGVEAGAGIPERSIESPDQLPRVTARVSGLSVSLVLHLLWEFYASVSMRQLPDHAAENSYGIPAFNVNNLEQVQAIMAAADEVGAPVILWPRPAPASTPVSLHPSPDPGRHRGLSAHPPGHAPGPRHLAQGLPGRHRPRLRLGDDGRLADGGRQTPSDFDYNVEVTRKTVEMALRCRRDRGRRTGLPLATSKPVKPAKKTASAPKASWTTARC